MKKMLWISRGNSDSKGKYNYNVDLEGGLHLMSQESTYPDTDTDSEVIGHEPALIQGGTICCRALIFQVKWLHSWIFSIFQ